MDWKTFNGVVSDSATIYRNRTYNNKADVEYATTQLKKLGFWHNDEDEPYSSWDRFNDSANLTIYDVIKYCYIIIINKKI